jgi:TonB family protein
MVTGVAVALVLGMMPAPQAPPPSAGADLTAVRALYAEGAYEEALSRLAAVGGADPTGEVATYNALCLLALGRSADVTRTLEALFVRLPTFRMATVEIAPPRLVAMYDDVRRRMLPAAAKDLYAKAKTSFDAKQFGPSVEDFRTLIALLGDPTLAGSAKSMSDLGLLAEGFLRLGEAELAAAAKAAEVEKARLAAAAASAAKAAPPAGASATSPTGVFSMADKTVTPPVEISRTMPPWNPTNAVARRLGARGVLSVLIDADGAVESVVIVTPISPEYDQLLLEAAKSWRFRPARRDGTPVRYELLVEIVLNPRQTPR